LQHGILKKPRSVQSMAPQTQHPQQHLGSERILQRSTGAST
jgi:hypothetical protein